MSPLNLCTSLKLLANRCRYSPANVHKISPGAKVINLAEYSLRVPTESIQLAWGKAKDRLEKGIFAAIVELRSSEDVKDMDAYSYIDVFLFGI